MKGKSDFDEGNSVNLGEVAEQGELLLEQLGHLVRRDARHAVPLPKLDEPETFFLSSHSSL